MHKNILGSTRTWLAATSALTMIGEGAVTQITITDNFIQTPEYTLEENEGVGVGVFKNLLYEDITGDGVSDVTITGAEMLTNGDADRNLLIRFDLNGERQKMRQESFANYITVGSDVDGGIKEDVVNGRLWEGVIALGITDANINGGVTTDAWLIVEAHHIPTWGANRIKLTKLVFDDESTINTVTADDARNNDYTEFSPVPEPSTTLLLGLAGLGFVVRRKR